MSPRKPKQRDGSEENPFILDAYTRVSLREQAEEGYSLEAQERAFREWQEEEARHGRHWQIRFHVEPGASAHSEVLEKRPVFKALLEGIENGEIDTDGFGVHKLDRASRYSRVSVRLFDALVKSNTGFISLSERGLDLTTPSGRLVLSVLAIVAQFFSDNLGTEVAKGKRERALGDGLSNACREPWGYERVDTKEPFALDEKDSQGYGLALSMWLSGYTDPEVAARLNAEGYRVWGTYQKRLRGGEEPVYELKPFNSRTVAAIRTNVWYRQFAPGSPYGTVRYKDELCEGRHPWLCSYEDWFRIQEVAQEKFRRSGNRRSEIPMEFKKRLVCTHCQRVMAVYYSNRFRDRAEEKRRQAQTGYRCRCRELNDDLCPCRSRILPSWKIIAQFGDWLEQHTRLPDDWQEKIRSRLLEQAASALSGNERADILGVVRRRQAELERIKDMYQLGDIDRAEYLARMREVQAALSGLRQRIQLGSIDARVGELSRAAMELINLASDWRDASALERAEATQALVETVFYDPLEQCIVRVSIHQKYRDVLVSTSGGETPA
jgi:resolvase-like protein